MATFLFDKIIFGPVRSRRLGVSLGVNLLPTASKVCSFDCIYCECGWTNSAESAKLPTREEIRIKMEERLKQMSTDGEDLDVITYAGNGEPTLHPEFAMYFVNNQNLSSVLSIMYLGTILKMVALSLISLT